MRRTKRCSKILHPWCWI